MGVNTREWTFKFSSSILDYGISLFTGGHKERLLKDMELTCIHVERGDLKMNWDWNSCK